MLLSALIAISSLAVLASAKEGAPVGTVPFIFDDNRVFAELTFIRPDGTRRKAFAYVDMGTPAPVVSDHLYQELRLGEKRPLLLQVGSLTLRTDPAVVQSDSGLGTTGPNGQRTVPVEAVLSGSQLKDYQVVIDYGRRMLTLARQDTLTPQGIPVPCRVNEATGLISVDAVIDGKTYPIAIDSGSAYTWFRKATGQHWLLSHPQWQRGIGAVGESNMQTRADGAEAAAVILRISDIILGELHLQQIGALGVAPPLPPVPPMRGAPSVHGDFFDWYSQKAPEPVIGWVGGNVLKGFQVMIDYPRHVTYWQREHELDPHDLDQVGLTLETRDGAKGYFVAAVARKDGRPTVEDIQAGDKLIRIDGIPLEGMTRGAIFSSLHGTPGDARLLTLDRDGREFDAHTRVSAF
jgi:hypothetical protein